MNKRTLNKLTKAIKKLPVYQTLEKIKGEWELVPNQPLVRIQDDHEDGHLAVLTSEDGAINDGAFKYIEIDYIIDLDIKMRQWAEKYGFRWECRYQGTYDLFEA